MPASLHHVETGPAGAPVVVGVGEWRKLSDFEEELIKEHNLVKMRGKLMTREQAEAIQAEQMVRPPANAVKPISG